VFAVPLMGAGLVALTVLDSTMIMSSAVPGITVMIGAARDWPHKSAAETSAMIRDRPRIVEIYINE